MGKEIMPLTQSYNDGQSKEKIDLARRPAPLVKRLIREKHTSSEKNVTKSYIDGCG